MSTPSDHMANQEKPRKLEDETATYLLEIDTRISSISDPEEKNILVENVLAEIQNRTASAACDRRTNYLIEQLCGMAECVTLLQLLQRWTPYSVFLARNRYASHIVQTVISRLCYFFKEGDLGDLDLNTMETTILEFARPLLHEIHWLGKEMSASHVQRSVICFMSGLPTIAEKKGKNSKHQHSVGFSEPLDGMIENNQFYITNKKSFVVPESFKNEVLNGIDSLLNKSKRELQLLIADTSSCALISLLIRVLSNPEIYPSEDSIPRLFKLYETVLEFPRSSDNNGANSVFYSMSGDKSGSYFLQVMLECSSLSHEYLPNPSNTIDQNALHMIVLHDCILGSIHEYVTDAYGNFVIQSIIRKLTSDYKLYSPQAKVSKQNQMIVEHIETSCQLFLQEFCSNHQLIQTLIQQKGGVIYWILELADTLQDISTLELLVKIILNTWQQSSDLLNTQFNVETLSTYISSRLQHCGTINDQYKQKKYSTSKYNNFNQNKNKGSTKEDNNDNKEDNETEELNKINESQIMILAKLLHRLLLISPYLSPFLCDIKILLGHIYLLFSNDLYKLLSTTSQFSQLVIDTFITQYANPSLQVTSAEDVEDPAASTSTATTILKIFKDFSIKYLSIGNEIASHFIGQHIITKIYDYNDLRGKEKWIASMMNNYDTLQKTKIGRNIIQLMNMELYKRDMNEWRKQLKKQMKANEAITTMLTNNNNTTNNTSSNTQEKPSKKQKKNHSTSEKADEMDDIFQVTENKDDQTKLDDDDNEDGDDGKQGNRKRKRKRSNKNKTNTTEE